MLTYSYFLGLKTLTVIRDTLDNIKKSKGIEIDSDQIDLDDPNIYKLISSGDTGGVFQLESSGITQFMKELKPEGFEDIIAGISLYRPGPMSEIPTYIRNKRDPSQITYLHPKLEPILDVTYGCMIYQEQIMSIVRDLGGFTMGRSDLVRRAMSKKKADVMEKEGHNFIYGETDDKGNILVEGCIRRGIPEETAKKIWDNMKDFAKYGFNKSHAAAYAVIACQTAWLKYYYPAEFYAALLSSVMGNEKRTSRYIEECIKRGIPVKAPSVNDSFRKYTVKDNEIIYGLGGIKSVGDAFIDSIITSRDQYGDFKTFLDFCERVDNSNKRAIISLIKAGAFDFLGYERGQLLANAFEIIARGQELRKIRLSGQESFFNSGNQNLLSVESNMTELEPLPQESLLAMEKEVLGIYLSGHPLRKYQSILDSRTLSNLGILDSFEELSNTVPDQSYVTFGGLITNIRTQLTKKGELMAFAQLEDQYGSLDLVIFPKTYDQFRHFMIEDVPVLVSGKLSYDEELNNSLIVNTFDMLEVLYKQEQQQSVTPQVQNAVQVVNDSLIIKLRDGSQKSLVKTIKDYLKTSPGSTPVILYFEKENQRFKASEALNVTITDKLIKQLSSIIAV